MMERSVWEEMIPLIVWEKWRCGNDLRLQADVHSCSVSMMVTLIAGKTTHTHTHRHTYKECFPLCGIKNLHSKLQRGFLHIQSRGIFQCKFWLMLWWLAFARQSNERSVRRSGSINNQTIINGRKDLSLYESEKMVETSWPFESVLTWYENTESLLCIHVVWNKILWPNELVHNY